MKVSRKMTREVHVASPDETIVRAARSMAELEAGVLPVGEEGRLIGMVTDRDIALRAVAAGKGPDTRVREVMSAGVKYCFADQEVEEVARNMGDIQLRRLPVVDREKRLVGILSLGDLALGEGALPAAEALAGVSRPGGVHSQIAGT